MKLFLLFKFLLNHPLNKNQKLKAIIRFVKWQIISSFLKNPIAYPFTEKTKILVKKSMKGATGNMYCGLHEFYDMSFLLHFLRSEDTFIDIGANIGSYTILASGHVGAKTISFEPIPTTYKTLLDNLVLNRITEKVIPFNMALGSKTESLIFTSNLDTTNHVVEENLDSNIIIKSEKLDNIIEYNEKVKLIKIDVEGFEKQVLLGALKTLNNSHLCAIIIETNNAGQKYGNYINEIDYILSECKFSPFSYDPLNRELTKIKSGLNKNTIYIKDETTVIKRVKEAEKFIVQNQKI
jgi:FkbM family methyltransferase